MINVSNYTSLNNYLLLVFHPCIAASIYVHFNITNVIYCGYLNVFKVSCLITKNFIISFEAVNEINNNYFFLLQEELICSIEKKVDTLKNEQAVIREEMLQNELLGQEIATRLQKVAKPNELEKYSLHVEEMEKIVNLLLSLSGRLARAENILKNLPKDSSEEKVLLLILFSCNLASKCCFENLELYQNKILSICSSKEN